MKQNANDFVRLQIGFDTWQISLAYVTTLLFRLRKSLQADIRANVGPGWRLGLSAAQTFYALRIRGAQQGSNAI